MPGWKAAATGPRSQKIANYSNPRFAPLCNVTRRLRSEDFPNACKISLSTRTAPEHQALVGKNMVELGQMQGKTPLEAMIDLALAENLETQFLIHGFANGDENASAA